MRMRAGRVIGALYLTVAVSGCSNPSEVPVRTRFLQQRLSTVDPGQPCIMEPYPAMQAELAHNAIYVPVKINGVRTIGQLDTGSTASLITSEFAKAAHMTLQAGAGTLVGISGSFQTDVGFTRNVEIGSIRRELFTPVRVYPFAGSHGLEVGALVGLDWLDHFDYDIDLKSHTIRPFRTSNCIIVDPPWRTTYTGLAITRGSSEQLNESGRELYTTFGFTAHLSIPVAFEGGMVDATLDTGSPDTIMSRDAAEHAGATSTQLDADRVETIAGVNGKPRKMNRHRFADVAIGEEEIRDFSILVAPGFNRRDVEMILGADYLGKRHFWLSLTTNTFFIDSSELRKPTPPFDHAHRIGGAQMPAYPMGATEPFGAVNAACMVAADGSLSDCRITKAASDPAFNKAAISWLTGGAGPVMQPRYENGHPAAEDHNWEINFQAPAGKIAPHGSPSR